jgi:hypothetical protein
MKSKPAKTFRDEDNAGIYRDVRMKDEVTPDMVPPTAQGYFRIPAVWIGSPPATECEFDQSSYSEVVLERQLKSGIFAIALRDGTFLFDFTESKIAPLTIIPGVSYPDAPKPWKIIPENTKAYRLAEERAILRSRLLNVHQLFLSDARRLVDKTGAMIGYPVSPWNMIDSISRYRRFGSGS